MPEVEASVVEEAAGSAGEEMNWGPPDRWSRWALFAFAIFVLLMVASSIVGMFVLSGLAG